MALPLALLLLVGGGAWIGLEAQSEPTLEELELAYEASRSAFESAVAAHAAVKARLDRVIREVSLARASGDEGRLERAFAQAQTESNEVERMDRRVEETGDRLSEASQGYLAMMDDRLEDLFAGLQEAATESEREGLAFIITDLNNRFEEVEAGVGVPDLPNTDPAPGIQFDPRDTSVERAAKAELLERRADDLDSTLVAIDDQLNGLARRDRRNRGLSQFLGDLRRFDDTNLPLGSTRPRGSQRPEDQASPADSLGAVTSPLTIPERIQMLELLRVRLTQDRDELRVRADLFRTSGGGFLA